MGGIFLSSSHRDAALAETVRRGLTELGFASVLSPDELVAGVDWRKTIRAAIEKSDAAVFLVASPEAAFSSWMGYEAGMAEALGKKVIVLASDRHSVSEYPPDLLQTQMAFFDPQTPETAVRSVAEILRKPAS